MDKSRFTPGPWRDAVKASEERVIVSGVATIIADLWHCGGEDYHNAKLIAAAPELLEAAVALVAAGDDREENAARSMLWSAIRKATE